MPDGKDRESSVLLPESKGEIPHLRDDGAVRKPYSLGDTRGARGVDDRVEILGTDIGDPILSPEITPQPQSLSGDFQIAESVRVLILFLRGGNIRITGHDDEMAESRQAITD